MTKHYITGMHHCPDRVDLAIAIINNQLGGFVQHDPLLDVLLITLAHPTNTHLNTGSPLFKAEYEWIGWARVEVHHTTDVPPAHGAICTHLVVTRLNPDDPTRQDDRFVNQAYKLLPAGSWDLSEHPLRFTRESWQNENS